MCTKKANTKDKESIFYLIIQYREKYSSTVQRLAYKGWHTMCASLKVHNLKVHV